ncbi:cytochrome P450 [Apodospora peruviana]|uniref:Cytochrome P450 n=1 Tax=Apodospora peruviana TaxID=516989 RepID=A0AAE0I5C0_9PEZI|nr:cytochrome P450 [Apodospora peruviana]
MALPLPLPLLSVLSISAWSAAGYLAYLVLYRCFLSPLARLPGPKLAALTSWYECYYDVAKSAQYVFKIKEMHAEYGPIVRIGPNDVSIADPEFVDTIYAPGPGHKRDKDHEKNKALGVDSSVGGSITHELHRRRREALNPFFSPQRIGRLDPELKSRTRQLEIIFAKVKDDGEVLNLSDVYFAFANDIVHNYCFGNSPNLLGDLQLAGIRRTNVAAVLGSVKIMLHFGWLRDLMQMLPPSIGSKMMPPGVRDMMAFRKDIRAQIDRILAGGRALDDEKERPPSIFSHLRDISLLPEPEKSAQRLEDEAVLMTMAGTYSPMLSLVLAHYHLLAKPEIMAKLRAELDANPSSIKASQLEQLPYLSGIIQEAHRLTFGLTGRNPRVCPDETLVYRYRANNMAYAYVIPPGTSLSASTLLIHTDESVFPDPWRFDPQRWISDDDQTNLARRRRSMLAFMRGPRACVGMHLANAEMAVALAAMARWDIKLFETTEEDVAFLHDYHVLCPRLGSKGVRVQVVGPRSAEE